MAMINFKKLPDNATAEQIKAWADDLVRNLEYMFNNLEEENFVESEVKK